MKIVFFGTPDYVLPVLTSLHREFSLRGVSPIVAVVTQKPMPTGRKQLLSYSPIDKWAHSKGIPVFYSPQELSENSINADLGVLAAYGEIIPQKAIDLFPKGILNIHPSLLPKYRGASPVQAAIIANETETGVTIIKIDSELDHGPIVAQFKEEIGEKDTLGTLRERLFSRASEVLNALITPYLSGKINLREQPHQEATFTTLVQKRHGFIPAKLLSLVLKGEKAKEEMEIGFVKDFSLKVNANNLDSLIRSLDPWPGVWTNVSIDKMPKRLKILKSHLEEGKFFLDEVQLEGKNPVSWKEFEAGYPTVELA